MTGIGSAGLLHLTRDHSSTIYLSSLRSDFNREPAPSTSADSSSRGILGGEASTRATIAAATKEDELIKAALKHPPKKHAPKQSAPAPRKSSASKPSTSREERRARSRSPVKESSHGQGGSRSRGSGQGAGKSRRPSNKGNRENRGDKGGKEKRKREYTYHTPQSFEQAWSSSFFSASLLLMLTTLGFIIKRIPILNEIPIGGRLSRCFYSWKLISKSKWVNRVISEGYKIPFKYVQVMKKLPTNPPSSP